MVGAGDAFVSPGLGGSNPAGVYGTLAVNIGGGTRFASIIEGTGTGNQAAKDTMGDDIQSEPIDHWLFNPGSLVIGHSYCNFLLGGRSSLHMYG